MHDCASLIQMKTLLNIENIIYFLSLKFPPLTRNNNKIFLLLSKNIALFNHLLWHRLFIFF